MKSIIFDLDGTLIDSMNVWTEADNELLGRYGHKPDEEYNKTIQSLTFTEGINYIINRYKINKTPGELSAELYDLAYHHYANTVELKAGTKEFLQKLKSKNIKMAIATSCIPDMCKIVLKKYDLEGFFETIVYSDEVGNNKTFPDIYLHTAKCIFAEPENCIVFEDAPHAVEGAKKAGMTVVGVYDDFSACHKKEMCNNCHYYINNFDEFDFSIL